MLLFRDFLYIQYRWWSDGQRLVFIYLLWLTECLKLINHMFPSNVIRLLKFWLINRVDFDFSGVLTWEIIQLISISDLPKFIRPNKQLNKHFFRTHVFNKKKHKQQNCFYFKEKNKAHAAFFHMHCLFRSNVLKIASPKKSTSPTYSLWS